MHAKVDELFAKQTQVECSALASSVLHMTMYGLAFGPFASSSLILHG